jgi:hypothetical protein
VNPSTNGKRPRGGQVKHGHSRLKRALREAGTNAIDKRTTVGKALAQWRSDLVEDLGGEATISTQQRALVELAVKSKLLLDSVDTWLLQQKSLINTRKKALLPVVRERQALADGLARYLGQLRLERRAKEPRDLAQLLEESRS